VAGQGVALARSALASLDLASGRLVRPVPQAVAAPFSYWIVCPKPKATAPKVARFEAWLVEQADLAGRAP
jgi:LysR family glycine cleavage system transcriptional activator